MIPTFGNTVSSFYPNFLCELLMTPPEPKKRKIDFLVKERAAKYGTPEISPRG